MPIVARSLVRAAIARACSATRSSEAPPAAARAASAATNPSAIDAVRESSTCTVPSKRSAANEACWKLELIEEATVTHTMARCPVRLNASRKSAGDGTEVDACCRSRASRW